MKIIPPRMKAPHLIQTVPPLFASTQSPTGSIPDSVQNLDFFPEISLQEFRGETRTHDSIDDGKVHAALQSAMFLVNAELISWRIEREQQGYPTLHAVPADHYGETSELVRYYLVAVHSLAKAALSETHMDTDTTDRGTARAESIAAAVDAHRLKSRQAIQMIIGSSEMDVELI